MRLAVFILGDEMKYLLGYIILFLIIFIIVYVFTFLMKSKREELGLSKSFRFIKNKYNLKMDKKRVRILAKVIAVANTFILSIPIYLVLVINIDYIFSLVISLVIFIVLILVVYNLIGYILKKKGW